MELCSRVRCDEALLHWYSVTCASVMMLWQTYMRFRKSKQERQAKAKDLFEHAQKKATVRELLIQLDRWRDAQEVQIICNIEAEALAGQFEHACVAARRWRSLAQDRRREKVIRPSSTPDIQCLLGHVSACNPNFSTDGELSGSIADWPDHTDADGAYLPKEALSGDALDVELLLASLGLDGFGEGRTCKSKMHEPLPEPKTPDEDKSLWHHHGAEYEYFSDFSKSGWPCDTASLLSGTTLAGVTPQSLSGMSDVASPETDFLRTSWTPSMSDAWPVVCSPVTPGETVGESGLTNVGISRLTWD